MWRPFTSRCCVCTVVVFRTGKRTSMGLLMDGYNSITRYVYNNFSDGFRQARNIQTSGLFVFTCLLFVVVVLLFWGVVCFTFTVWCVWCVFSCLFSCFHCFVWCLLLVHLLSVFHLLLLLFVLVSRMQLTCSWVTILSTLGRALPCIGGPGEPPL